MKKILLGLLIFLSVIAAVFYFGANFILEKASRQAMSALAARGRSLNLDIMQADFGSARLSSFNSITWKNFRLYFNLMKDGVPDPQKAYVLLVDEVTAKLKAKEKILAVSGRGVRVTPSQASETGAGKLEGESFSVEFGVGDFEPESVVRKVSASAQALIRDMSEKAHTEIPAQFEGKATFMIEERPTGVRVRMEAKGSVYALVMDKADLRNVSDTLTERLTGSEIDFLSEHPVQTPELLRIKERAQKTARQAHERDDSVPEDAYRHVLWNYLLVKAFDESLAKQVTDAHEEDEISETDADHQMDLNNNAVGRSYAAAGYEESSLLERVKTDPAVILTPTT